MRTVLSALLLLASLTPGGLTAQSLLLESTPTTAFSDFVVLPDAAAQALLGPDLQRIGVFLGVQDTKHYQDRERPLTGLTAVVIDEVDGPVFSEIAIDWPTGEPASDLESICHLPGTQDEFLAVESGYYEGRYGRVFHLQVSAWEGRWEGTVLGSTQLPGDIVEVEGTVCLTQGERTLLVVGERGGDPGRTHGQLRWAITSLTALPDTLTMTTGQPFSAAADLGLSRDVTGMYLDPNGLLWISSADDPGDYGPFRSAVQLAGSLSFDEVAPVELLPEPITVYYTDEMKIEGVGAGVVSGAHLSVVTEEEALGGKWYPLRWSMGLPFSR